MQGKESAEKSDASSDRNDVRRFGLKLYDWEAAQRRAAHWSAREGSHNTEAGKVGSVHGGAAAPNHLPDGTVASDTPRAGDEKIHGS